jgi:hypothetical protein
MHNRCVSISEYFVASINDASLITFQPSCSTQENQQSTQHGFCALKLLHVEKNEHQASNMAAASTVETYQQYHIIASSTCVCDFTSDGYELLTTRSRPAASLHRAKSRDFQSAF